MKEKHSSGVKHLFHGACSAVPTGYVCTGSCFYSKPALDVPVCNPVKCCLFLIGFCWERKNIGLLGLMLQPEEEEERRTEVVGTDPSLQEDPHGAGSLGGLG